MGPIVIETQRLNLRSWTAEDVPAFVALLSDPEVSRFVNHGEPVTAAEADAFVVRYERLQRERGWCRWFVEHKDEPGRLCGFVGPGCTFAPEIELGWTIRRDLWGQGIATEAARGALAYLFDVVGLAYVVSAIDPENARSEAVARRLGMRPEGTLAYQDETVTRWLITNPHPPAASGDGFVRDCEGEPAGSALSPDSGLGS